MIIIIIIIILLLLLLLLSKHDYIGVIWENFEKTWLFLRLFKVFI